MPEFDTRIPLLYRPAESGIETPLESQAKVAKLKTLQLEQQGMQLEQAQRAQNFRDEQQLKQVLAQHVAEGGDPNDTPSLLKKIYPINPMLGIKMQRQWTQDQQKAALAQQETATAALRTRQEQLAAHKAAQDQVDEIVQRFGAILQAPEQLRPALHSQMRQEWLDSGRTDEATLQRAGIGPEYNENKLKVILAGLQHGTQNKLKWIEHMNAAGEPVGEFVPEQAGVQYPVLGKGVNPEDVQNVKDTVQGWKAGLIPPELPARGSRTGTALYAEAQRQGYDLAKANEDWKATQKYLQTLNGPQQVRLGQAIRFTKESLPLVDSLVEDWHARGPALLTKANLLLAEQGAYGADWASKARRLKAQIADLQSELGTVYKGGNSSTDESLRLAAENIKADWDYKSMKDALAQISQNLTIRENSIRHGRATTTTPEQTNPYQPTPGKDPLSIR